MSRILRKGTAPAVEVRHEGASERAAERVRSSVDALRLAADALAWSAVSLQEVVGRDTAVVTTVDAQRAVDACVWEAMRAQASVARLEHWRAVLEHHLDQIERPKRRRP